MGITMSKILYRIFIVLRFKHICGPINVFRYHKGTSVMICTTLCSPGDAMHWVTQFNSPRPSGIQFRKIPRNHVWIFSAKRLAKSVLSKSLFGIPDRSKLLGARMQDRWTQESQRNGSASASHDSYIGLHTKTNSSSSEHTAPSATRMKYRLFRLSTYLYNAEDSIKAILWAAW